MTQYVKIAGVSVAIAAIVLAFIFLGRGGDEQQIHDQLDRLEELGSKPAGESQIQSLTQAKKIADCFTEQAEVRIMPRLSYSSDRKELTGMMVGARSQVDSSEVSLGNRNIKVSEDGQRATVIITGTASIVVGGQSERHKDRYRMEWVKVDGDWLIASVAPQDN
ncbi:nuclear transport factor 2 family protein [Ruficoccus sp. ZRK36]|uniref:nuclear transport factor 2 family protein n=1 Tax=Ruficoccus sp. ZRK36 TaxID=2866311 RepID=UPI001C72DFF9|nr:nuclear transport factor 2 family protein [Ruficoccus sp. ZRK36]QYY34837.1 nuclear transport factor 2 family protein [Ruficoccus sp. ZRK36]